YLYQNKIRPEQVQDFYPTPGTVSTCMFYTELDPYTLKPVYVAKQSEEKAMQRALLQYYDPKNTPRVHKALLLTHREDLIPHLAPGAHTQTQKPSENVRKSATAQPFVAKNVLTPHKGAKTWPKTGNTAQKPRSKRK
ncbi:MAG: DUF3362 domain-containing protein, partial [Ruthenibacterium sp.]